MLLPDLTELLSYKQVIKPGHKLALLNNAYPGEQLSFFAGCGKEFESARSYVQGDDVRHIDWRLTAKMGSPYTKTYKSQLNRNVFLIIDCNAYMRFGTKNTFKSVIAAQISAQLLWLALAYQDSVGSFVFGDVDKSNHYIPSSSKTTKMLLLLNKICQPPKLQDSLVSLESIKPLYQYLPKPATFFCIVDPLHSLVSQEKTLQQLRAYGKVVIVWIYDKADYQLPATGTIISHTPQGIVEIDCSDKNTKERYYALWQQQYNYWQEFCYKLNIPLILHGTEQNIWDFPNKLFQQMKYAR